jgi:hypothetical protein
MGNYRMLWMIMVLDLTGMIKLWKKFRRTKGR